MASRGQMTTVATERLVCIRPDGKRVDVRLEIGRPYDTGHGDWACPVRLEGLRNQLADIHGVSSLQALCLAASLLRSLLMTFIEDGGQVLHDDGSAFNVDSTFSSISS